ncbi:MAG: cytochrome C oxidase subunit IV family protein [Verrucomicrobiota bacterium]
MSRPVPRTTYIRTWLALVLLLGATWGSSLLDLRPFNTAIALSIAVGKMVLILLFFMHMRSARRFLWVFVCAGFVWLLVLLELTLTDYLTRPLQWAQTAHATDSNSTVQASQGTSSAPIP